MTSSSASDLDRLLRAIADPRRRRILLLLKEQGGFSSGQPDGLCAADIEQHVGLAQPTISHHMRVLEKAGLIEVKKQGHWRWYRRNEKRKAELIRALKLQL